MDDELIIEVDKKDNKIGVRLKNDFYTGKYIHRSAHLLLINSKDEALLQKRALDKKWYPGLYTFSASGTVADESYDDCIKREMQEEIGISVPCKRVLKYYYKGNNDNAFHELFIARSDAKISPDKREMSEIRWLHMDALKDDIIENPGKYTPPFVKGMTLFFEKFNDWKKLV